MFSQINLNIKDKKVDFFRLIEKKNNSELFQNNSNYINEPGVGQPIIYKRKQSNLPELLVYYFPYTKDSTISYILYEWQDKEKKVRDLMELKSYFSKYNEILNQITAEFGYSKQEGSLEDVSQIENSYLRRKDRWRNDTTNIELYITLANKYLVKGNISITPTHTIRLYVKNAQITNVDSALSTEKIAILDNFAKLFLSDLIAGKFEELKKYLNLQVVLLVKNEQLTILKGAIVDDNWDLVENGTLLANDGKRYLNFIYRRKAELKNEPIVLLSILFDQDGKIIAILPRKKTVDH